MNRRSTNFAAAMLLAWTLPAAAEPADESLPVELRHDVIERAPQGASLSFTASVSNCDDCSVVVFTKTLGRSFFGRLPMTQGPGGFEAVLDAGETTDERLRYYVEVRDSSGEVVARSGGEDEPHLVTLDATMSPPPLSDGAPSATVAETATPSAPPIPLRTRCGLGPKASYIRYEEPGLMEEAGLLMGVVGSCTHGARTFVTVDAQLAAGWVDYEGKLMDGTPYDVENNFNTLFELRAVAGTRLFGQVRGYAGFGYRRLFDGLGHDAAGYDRTSRYIYSPLGALLATRAGGTEVVARVEYRHFWSGRQTSELSDLVAGLPDVTNKQRHGYGLNLQVSIATTLLAGRTLSVEPYVSYWSIEDSDYAQVGVDGAGQPLYLYEPKNNSTEVGFNLAVDL